MFRKLIHSNYTIKRYISALHITGEKASETFAVLTPHIDFEDRLLQKQELEKNLQLRHSEINLDDVTRLWNFYKHLESKKNTLEDSKQSISKTIINLGKKGGKYAEKIDTLKAHGKMVKEDLRILKEQFWEIEEKAVVQALSIPNVLHPLTPDSEIKVIHSFKHKPEIPQPVHHLTHKNLIEYNNPYNYYLRNNAALFELNITNFTTNELISRDFQQFSNSDLCRSVVLDGVGLKFYDRKSCLTINDSEKHENSRLHLVGGASLSSFMAYYCKHTVFPTQLPLKYFTNGRKYQPPLTVNLQQNSLFNVAQETSINLFVATKDNPEITFKQFEETLNQIIAIYEKLNYHFRVGFIPANRLEKWESLRASLEMYSPFLGEYIEIANLSLCGNYISKRLLFNYGKGAKINYPGIINGTIISVPKLLACILECNETLSPDVFNINKTNIS